MGRLSPEKGHMYLIEAFSRVKARSIISKLFILGDGPLKPHLEKFCVNLGVKEDVIEIILNLKSLKPDAFKLSAKPVLAGSLRRPPLKCSKPR